MVQWSRSWEKGSLVLELSKGLSQMWEKTGGIRGVRVLSCLLFLKSNLCASQIENIFLCTKVVEILHTSWQCEIHMYWSIDRVFENLGEILLPSNVLECVARWASLDYCEISTIILSLSVLFANLWPSQMILWSSQMVHNVVCFKMESFGPCRLLAYFFGYRFLSTGATCWSSVCGSLQGRRNSPLGKSCTIVII